MNPPSGVLQIASELPWAPLKTLCSSEILMQVAALGSQFTSAIFRAARESVRLGCWRIPSTDKNRFVRRHFP